jgi:hypothetical protein
MIRPESDSAKSLDPDGMNISEFRIRIDLNAHPDSET